MLSQMVLIGTSPGDLSRETKDSAACGDLSSSVILEDGLLASELIHVNEGKLALLQSILDPIL